MMRLGAIQCLSNSTHLITVTPSDIQSLRSTLSIVCYTSAIPNPLAQHQYQDALVQYTQGYNIGQRSDAAKLMLNIKLECSMGYSQHFQSYNSCAIDLMLNKKYHNSCAPGITPNTSHKSIMHPIFCTIHHNNHLSIYIRDNDIIINLVHRGLFPVQRQQYFSIMVYA